MTNTALSELMKKANPLMAHKITVLYKLCQQRGLIVDSMITANTSYSKYDKRHAELATEIERIDAMILKILEKTK